MIDDTCYICLINTLDLGGSVQQNLEPVTKGNDVKGYLSINSWTSDTRRSDHSEPQTHLSSAMFIQVSKTDKLTLPSILTY